MLAIDIVLAYPYGITLYVKYEAKSCTYYSRLPVPVQHERNKHSHWKCSRDCTREFIRLTVEVYTKVCEVALQPGHKQSTL